jgi:hypothetical protein
MEMVACRTPSRVHITHETKSQLPRRRPPRLTAGRPCCWPHEGLNSAALADGVSVASVAGVAATSWRTSEKLMETKQGERLLRCRNLDHELHVLHT